MDLVIVHGYTATPESHWFRWLARSLSADGISATIPAMPHTAHPVLAEWTDALGAIPMGADTIVVGHSLGCIALVRSLVARGSVVRGGLFVAGFAEPLPNLPALDGFTADHPRIEEVIPFVPRREVISSDDDGTVAPPFTARFAERLGAPLEIVPGAGHFLDRQGFTELPPALAAVRRML